MIPLLAWACAALLLGYPAGRAVAWITAREARTRRRRALAAVAVPGGGTGEPHSPGCQHYGDDAVALTCDPCHGHPGRCTCAAWCGQPVCAGDHTVLARWTDDDLAVLRGEKEMPL